MAKTIEDLFYWLAFATDASIILIFFLLFKQKLKLNAIWLLLVYTILNFSINAIVEYIQPNLVYTIYAFFTFFEFALFTAFIYSFIKSVTFKKLMLILSILFSLFLPFYYIFSKQRYLDSVPIGIETILILVFSFYYFFEQMSDIENHYIYNRSHFWVITGMILYLSGSFFIYIFANHVEKGLLFQYWFLTYIFYVIKNLLFITGILSFHAHIRYKQTKGLYPYLN